MKTKAMAMLVSILTILILILIFGITLQNQKFKKEVKLLFSQSTVISDKSFSYDQLINLPEPVQKYFKHALKEGQPYISYVRLKHDGQFKTSQKNDWSAIEGEQYFTTKKPGFIWKGNITGATAYDKYLSDQGRLQVNLLNLIKVVDASGDSFDQGELLRWLGESFWFPTNLLPNDRLKWFPIDTTSAKINFSYKGIDLDYTVIFNERNEVESIETQRYMEEDKLESWLGEFSDYKRINDVLIPTKVKASWLLSDGKFTYVDFHLKEIEYDNPNSY